MGLAEWVSVWLLGVACTALMVFVLIVVLWLWGADMARRAADAEIGGVSG